MLNGTLADKAPETPWTDPDAWLAAAEAAAEKVRVPGARGETESGEGEAVTPLDKPDTVTEAAPVKPPCTVWVAPPGVKVTAAGERERMKLGVGHEPPLFPLPEPQPVMNAQKRPTVTAQYRSRFEDAPRSKMCLRVFKRSIVAQVHCSLRLSLSH